MQSDYAAEVVIRSSTLSRHKAITRGQYSGILSGDFPALSCFQKSLSCWVPCFRSLECGDLTSGTAVPRNHSSLFQHLQLHGSTLGSQHHTHSTASLSSLHISRPGNIPLTTFLHRLTISKYRHHAPQTQSITLNL